MDETHFDQSLKVLASSAGRRDAVRALGAVGMAALAGLGLFGAPEPALAGKRARRRKRRRKKRAQQVLDQACQAICGETCAGCQETCDATCDGCSICFHQTDGPPLCATGASWIGCPECTSSSDCAAGEHCVTGQTFASNGATERLGGSCEYSVGLCISISHCVLV